MYVTSSHDTTPQISGKLAEVFAKINMSELPAMSPHVQELISLAYNSKAGAYELAEVILKDYSLTNKVLQVVNSAYYGLDHQVSSISRAVTILGFDAVRNMATAVAIFEDFVKSGIDKVEISKLITRSFLSGLLAREIADKKNLNVQPEEAFICSLLHRLGRIVVCLYLPDLYWEIKKKIEEGCNEEEASWQVMEGLSLPQLGEEVARFWNMSEKIISSMEECPPKPINHYDEMGYLRNLADFTNCLVDHICDETDFSGLFAEYENVIPLDMEESVEFIKESMAEAESMSRAARYGLTKLRIIARIITYENQVKRLALSAKIKKVLPAEIKPEITASLNLGGDEEKDEKNIDDFIRDITESLMGPFSLNDLHANIMEGLYFGVGFDRAIMAAVTKKSSGTSLVSRFTLGDVDPRMFAGFDLDVDVKSYVIPRCIKTKTDMAIPPGTKEVFPEDLAKIVQDRTVYLLPIILYDKPFGLIYLDRNRSRPALSSREIKTVRLFRDFAVMAIKKSRQQKKM